MNRLELLKVMLYPVRPLFGSGFGNIKVLKGIYRRLVSVMVPKQSVVVDVDGYKLGMIVGGDRGLDSLGVGLILGNGYEVETTKLFKCIVKAGMNVVDVGAHIGYYTMMAAQLVGDKGKVWSYEPEPKNYDELVGNIRLNGIENVLPYRQAVGGENGISNLFVSDDLSGECSLVNVKNRPSKTIKVDVIILDDVLGGERVDVMKIDVDGGEMGVIAGAKQLIQNNPSIKIFSEIFKEGLRCAGYSCADYWNALEDCGFKYIYLIDDKEGLTRPATLDDLLEYLKKADGANLMCSKVEIGVPFRGRIPRVVTEKLHKRVHKRLDILCGVIKDNDRVLEVGCGTGANVVNALKYLPVHVVAIDNDEASLDYAVAKNRHNNVEFVLANGETYEDDRKFDVIVCSQILEHLNEPLVMLRNMRRLLKDNGILYVGVPNGYGCFEVENYIPRMVYKTNWGRRLIDRVRMDSEKDSLNTNSQHVRFFTMQGIVDLLKEAGWRIESRTNEEVLGGVLTDRTILKPKRIANWNLKIAEKLPPSLANGWIFICRKDTQRLKEEVKRYWDAEPCGTRNIKYPEGSLEYYEAISANRYKTEPLLYRFAEFDKWEGKRILEVGCGVGSDLVEFAKKGANITGIDLSPKSVALARKRLEVFKLQGNVFEGDVERISFEDNVFDMVYSYGVLHHTPDIKRAIAEIHRVVRPGGEIRIMLYHKPSLVALQMYLLFGLFRFKPFRGIDDILANHHESKGTKAYTIQQVQDMFSMFEELTVKPVVLIYDIRYAPSKYLPRFIMKFIPARFGWNILIKGRK